MRTNIILNDMLLEEAFKYSVTIRTKKELIETALKEYIQNRKIKDLRELKGKVFFSEGYDYKKMRIKNDFINMAKIIKKLKLYSPATHLS